MANAQDSMKDLLNAMESFITSKSVVGEPIRMDDAIILPLVDVSFGAGVSGKGSEEVGKKNGTKAIGGLGAKMSPSAVLVIKDGKTRLVNIKNQDTITKVLDVVPDLIDKVKGTFKKEDQKIREVVEAQENELD